MQLMIETLIRNGFAKDEARRIVQQLQDGLGEFSTRTIAENILVDQVTGKVAITKRAEEEYRKLFSSAGINLKDCLSSESNFYRAYRKANGISFSLRLQSGPELEFLK